MSKKMIEEAREFLITQDWWPFNTQNAHDKEVVRTMAAFAEAVAPKWVRVEDESPNVEDWYWVTTTKSGDAEAVEAHFVNGEWRERCVVAWMPKITPAPFQEEADNGD